MSRGSARPCRSCPSHSQGCGDGPRADALRRAPAGPCDTSPAKPRIELAGSKDALLAEDRFDRIEPALVVRRALVLVSRHALDATPQEISVHQAGLAEGADERIRQQFPIGELVFGPVDR